MRKPKENPRTTVAIIGSGMAGLVTGYLLKQDQNQQFDVQVFEMQDKLSLDSASITAPTEDGKGVRVDLPMRAFAGGFYSNLRRMYKHLGVKYVPIQFLFPLSQVPGSRKSSLSSSHGRENDADCHGEGDDEKTIPSKPYFIHSSNNHRIPPVRPEHLGFWGWTTEFVYLSLCFLWYTLCCFLIPPYSSRNRYQSVSSLTGATRIEDASLAETLGEYLERIMLPKYFTQNYIIPQFSAVTTCSHEDLLKFPAKDLIEYSTQTYNVPYYVVQGGVNVVQKILAEGLNIQLNSRVISVESQSGPSSKVRVSYRVGGEGTLHQRDFDHAILAVTPDVVGAIFQPLRSTMTHLPTTIVESIVHHDTSSLHPLSQTCHYGNKESNATSSYGYSSSPPPETQVIHVRSSPAGFTEAIHECGRSVFVTTVPITPINPSKIIHRTRFTRVLRTPQSKEVVNRIFGRDPAASGVSEKSHQWRNGNGNVWLVGGWCWDGMVLLEGCVVSAMRVADALGVHVPWRTVS
ncbi:conserved hypothetical protein [Histoplasma capsulatum G186AR]|uniref:Amine oxidase domain-containing protein n=2 Tax=Ajellomyces capsulatus TaxID=5037 RepID=C0ND29_AJECG|nr:uncharacterized protein HCBG_01025 [Histoplasma capsulatum G186AR]EEH11570.1 conserved hypothetical protein [Histoplasma capsulatum G186AR]